MGNICGKADSDAFSQPGRVLGSAPPQQERSSVPARITIGGPPRTLGGQGQASGGDGDGTADARKRAAEAAQARAEAASSKSSSGKLGAQLAAQKKQTRIDTLQEISNNERLRRDADEATQARAHN
ncbi:hypothetical protein F5Y17DRAFT_413882 [Xylariaceae sp. FL0594]|nr:hypothetical protein F5Y17DRAFT_413882 [Xylariaceae sp. FL0594]